MAERKRLTSTEQKEFINLCAAESLTQMDSLIGRINNIPDGVETLVSMRASLMELVEGILDQMPFNQLQSYQKQMKHIAISVGVKNAGNYDDWDGRYLRFSEINALLEGCQDHCLMCEKDPVTMKRCPIRKIYDAIPAESTCSVLSCDD